MDTVRETGEKAPAPNGDFDGMTRAEALRQLLATPATRPGFLTWIKTLFNSRQPAIS